MSPPGRPRSLLGAALSGLLVLAVLGEGGVTPLMLFAIHLGLVLLFVGILSRPAPRGDPPPGLALRPLVAWAVFLSITAAGALLAPYGYAAYLVLVELAASLAVAALAARVGPALALDLGAAVVWGGAFEGVLAGYQRFFLLEPRPAGTFLNPNHLGAWLVVAVVLGLGAWPASPTRARLLVRGMMLVPAAAGIFLCGSRGALVALAAAVLFLAIVVGRGMERTRRVRLLGAATLLLGAASIGVAARIARSPDPFAYHRLRIWKASLGAVVGAPWTGAGPGQFKTVAANLNFPLEGSPLRYERFFVSPHSDLLRVPCEVGWPGAAAFLLALILAAVEVRRRIRSGSVPVSALAATAALVGLLAQAAVDDLTDRPALYLLASALLGSLLSTARPVAFEAPLGLRVAGAGLLAAVFAAGEVSPLLALDEVSPSLVLGERSSKRDLPRGRLDRAEHERLARALQRNPLHPDAWLHEAEHIAGDGSDWTKTDYASAREAAEHAVRLQPGDAQYRLGLARIERLACATLFRDEASRARTARAYEDAQERARHDPFLPLEKGRFLLETGDPSGAERAALQALEIEPGAVPPRFLLAEAILAAGDAGAPERAAALVQKAEEVAVRAESLPKETPYARELLTLEPRWRDSLRARVARSGTAGRVDSGAPSP